MKNKKQVMHLFLLFFKIGTVTFGGGVTMVPILMREFVQKRQWMKEEELAECFALAQSMPGVLAINVAVFAGFRLKGKGGALAAAVGAMLPAVIGILITMKLIALFPVEQIVAEGLKGVKSASVALILCTVLRLSKNVLTTTLDTVLFVSAFVAAAVFGVNAILLVCCFIVIGLLEYLWIRRKKTQDD